MKNSKSLSRSWSLSRSRTSSLFRSQSRSRSRTKPGPSPWFWSWSHHISGPCVVPGPIICLLCIQPLCFRQKWRLPCLRPPPLTSGRGCISQVVGGTGGSRREEQKGGGRRHRCPQTQFAHEGAPGITPSGTNITNSLVFICIIFKPVRMKIP